jgi:DNA-binding NarL/FixJ family response regulator
LLEIDPDTIPEKFHLLLRCLQKAAQTPKIRLEMEDSDTIYDELLELVELAQYKTYYEQELQRREEEQRMREEEQRMREEAQQRQEEELQRREFFELQAVKSLYAQNFSLTDIALQLQLSEARVEELLQNLSEEEGKG